MSQTPQTAAAALSDDEVDALRAQLPAVEHVAYLNAGTLGPMPRCAIEAIALEADRDAHVRQDADLWERLTAAQVAGRRAIAMLTGVGEAQVALMHSTHEGLNACLWGLGLVAGDSVVTTDEEHPGLLVPLRHVRDRLGVEVHTAPWRSDADAFVDGVLACVGPRTRAVALSHVSWITGRIAPLQTLRDALPQHVSLIVDGAQSAGAMHVDPSDGWDAYTVSGQKWPCGPNGSGGLALIDPERWSPTFGAYMQVGDPLDCLGSPLVADGRRLETSQEAIAPLLGFAAATAWLSSDVGVERVHAHACARNAQLRAALLAGGTGFDEGALHGDAHLLCIDLPKRGTALAVVAALIARGTSVRALGADRIRVSLGAWTTVNEVDQLATDLGELLPGQAAST